MAIVVLVGYFLICVFGEIIMGEDGGARITVGVDFLCVGFGGGVGLAHKSQQGRMMALTVLRM